MSLSTAGGLAAEEETTDMILEESDGTETEEGSGGGTPLGGTFQYKAMEREMLQNLDQVNSSKDTNNIQDVSTLTLHRLVAATVGWHVDLEFTSPLVTSEMRGRHGRFRCNTSDSNHRRELSRVLNQFKLCKCSEFGTAGCNTARCSCDTRDSAS